MTDETQTVCRAVTLPVAAPVGLTWGELDAALVPAFRLATDLANWAVHYLFRRDTPGAADVPEAVKKGSKERPAQCYLYDHAKREFPDWDERVGGGAVAANAVLNRVHDKYLRDRRGFMHGHDSSLLTYRYPQPYPVPAQNWTLEMVARDGKPCPVVSLPLAGAGRVALRLLADGPYWRQGELLKPFFDGIKKGEAALLRDGKGQLLLKLVGHFPKVRRGKSAANACFLHTDPHALLVAEINGRPPWILNCDQLRRWSADHRTYLQRVAEDTKREKRMDRRQRANLNTARELRCAKHDNRLTTAVQQVVAQVGLFWRRQGVGLVAFDDTRDEYFRDGFRWHDLKTRLKSRAEELGVEWIDGARYMGAAVTEHRPTPPGEPAGSRGVYLSFPEQERDEWLLRVKSARATALAGARAVAHARRKGPHPAVSPRSPRTPSPPRATSPASAKR